MSEPPAPARRIQHALRAMAAQDCETVLVPPYAAFIDHENALPFFSYAIPQAGAGPPWEPGPLDALSAAFAAAGRRPRFEFVTACWPGLAGTLTATGFAVEAQLVGMTCVADALVDRPPPSGITIERVDRRSSDEAISALLAVKWAPFEELDGGPRVDAEAVARYRRTGAASVLARTSDGEVAGSAGWLGVEDGVGEIVAVGVLPRFRGRGIAGALTAEAGRAARDAGAELLFLTYEDEGPGRVYARAGFTPEPSCALIKLAASPPGE